MNPLFAASNVGGIIPALVPRPLPRPPIRPAALSALSPQPVLSGSGADRCLVATASLDLSGRFRAQRLIQALGWVPGQHLALRIEGAATVVICPDPRAPHTVTSRGLVVLPFAVRRCAGLDAVIVAIAFPADQLMVVVPAHRLAAALTGSEAGHAC